MTHQDLAWKAVTYILVLLCIKYAIKVFFRRLCSVFSGFGISTFLVALAILLALVGFYGQVSCVRVGSILEQYLGVVFGNGNFPFDFLTFIVHLAMFDA
jgi:hypothetical protein